MGDLLLFPLARAHGIVRRFACAQAAHDTDEGVAAAWRSTATELANTLFGVVPDGDLDQELYRLMDAASFAAKPLRAARQRAAAKRQARSRLRLVQLAQGDLFAWAAKPVAAIRIEGDADATAS